MHADNECRPAHGAHRDRAATVATAVIAIIVHALRDRLVDAAVDLRKARAAIENYLRDEFDNLARQVRGERDAPVGRPTGRDNRGRFSPSDMKKPKPRSKAGST